MRRRLLMALAVPALLSSLACGGVVDATFEAVRDLTSMFASSGASPAQRAQRYCTPALNNARLYEEVPPIDELAIRVCESWYGSSASEEERAILTCMAEVSHQAGWDACRGPLARAEEELVASADRYGIESSKGRKVALQVSDLDLDREIAEAAGVLGVLRDGSELDGLFGSSGLDSELTGGIGGLGSRGSGLGGGGTAEALGGLGTAGRGSGASGYGSGGGHFGSTGEGATALGGDPIILGALDKSLIDAVIKRHMNQLRYCYQRELLGDPDLAGKIVVKFVVAKDGTVSSATTKRTTMNNSAVENCINGRFMRFQFPEPKGGGIVIVSYPFVFRSGS